MKTILTFFCLLSGFVQAQQYPCDSLCKESDFWNVVGNRRSVRKFKANPVPESDILKIIDAARMAPTSGNQQPWKFIVIQDSNTISRLKEASVTSALNYTDRLKNPAESYDQYVQRIKGMYDSYFSAPVFIVVLTDNNSRYPDYNHWDGPLAAGYLMLAARALGYGTVFITDAITEEVTKEVLSIPDNFTRVCITPLGVPLEWPKTPEKKKLEELIIQEHF